MEIVLGILSLLTSLGIGTQTGFSTTSGILLVLALPVWYVAWFFVILGLEALLGWLINAEAPVKQPKKFWYYVMAGTARQKLFLNNVRIKVAGKENIPAERAVYVCNHPSGFDMMAMLAKLSGKRLVCLTQKEEELHLNASILHKCGLQRLEKPGSKQNERAIRRAAAWLKEDIADVCFAPEGKVSKNGDLQAFRPGAFQTALQAKAPVVVVTFLGAQKLDNTFLLKRKRITMQISKPIMPEAFDGKNPVELGTMVRKMMKENLKDRLQC